VGTLFAEAVAATCLSLEDLLMNLDDQDALDTRVRELLQALEKTRDNVDNVMQNTRKKKRR
jgi:hypothetical protein